MARAGETTAPPQGGVALPEVDEVTTAVGVAPDAPSRARDADKPLRLRVGSLIAERYDVRGVLGEGGMGLVYKCQDRNTGELVAVKRVMPTAGKGTADYITWFYKEARALASLDHLNIVHARDFGVLSDGSPFLTMELVGGLSLHDYSNARLSFPIIWSIVDQVLGALAHAHSRRVIHGDLKPSNIIVEAGSAGPPRIHILDFGLAWLKEDPHDERLDGEKAMEFEPHAGAGTPGYMAPEQIMHEMHHITGATDLYSLACILYRLLSGVAPFSGTPKELLKLHAYETPPPLRLATKAPEGVAEFVMRCLHKRPWGRFEFAAEARRAWAVFAPSPSTDIRLWRFPRIASHPATEPSAENATHPPDDPTVSERPPERNRGLLGIRPSPMVGREEIRRQLSATCAQVARGEGPRHRLIMLLGPAGIGKSRVAEWLTENVHERGELVPLTARYRKVRSHSNGMLGAVTQYLNFERADRATIERSLMARWNVKSSDQAGRTWVAGAAEWLRPNAPGSEAIGPSGVRFTLDTLEIRREVVRYTLRRLAGGRPILMLLDDVHNASQHTIEGLIQMHRSDADQPLVLVATVRSEDVQLGTTIAERLRALREAFDGEVIEVPPMDKDTTTALIQASLPLDQAAVLEAARRSRGYPLFALQQLHAWAHSGSVEYADGTFHVPKELLALRPKTTSELWDTRLSAIPPTYRDAAFAVATLGLDVRRPVLRAVLVELGLPVEESIQALQRAEVILPRGSGRYNWPHALLQEHLFRSLSKREDSRRLFHAAAVALESHPLSHTRRVVRQRAVNLLYAGEAGAAARAFFAFLEQSWNGARQPLATLADLDLFKGQLDGAEHAIALRWRAETLRHVGRTEEAKVHAEKALALLRKNDEPEELAHCQRLLGQLLGELGRSQEGLDLVTEALQSLSVRGKPLAQAQCELAIGRILMISGRHGAARQFAEAGEAHFSQLDEPLGRGQCLLLLSNVDHTQGATERARRYTTEARTEFERCGYRLGQAQTTASLAHLEHRLSNFYSAQMGAQEALAIFESLHTVRGQAACERLLAMLGLDTDDLDAGYVHADRAERLYAQLQYPWGIVESRLLRAQLALAARDFAGAKTALMQARDVPVSEPEPRQHYLLTRAWFQLLSGENRAAYEALKAAPTVYDLTWQVGDHTPHLLARLSRLDWGELRALDDIEEWRGLIHDHSRRDQT